jgi:hypothetical protein
MLVFDILKIYLVLQLSFISILLFLGGIRMLTMSKIDYNILYCKRIQSVKKAKRLAELITKKSIK